MAFKGDFGFREDGSYRQSNPAELGDPRFRYDDTFATDNLDGASHDTTDEEALEWRRAEVEAENVEVWCAVVPDVGANKTLTPGYHDFADAHMSDLPGFSRRIVSDSGADGNAFVARAHAARAVPEPEP